MKEDHYFFDRLTFGLELPSEIFPSKSIAELAGDHRVLIECHKGIVEYTDQKIGISVDYGVLYVCGSNLSLMRITAEQVVISGKIDGLEIQRRNCNR